MKIHQMSNHLFILKLLIYLVVSEEVHALFMFFTEMFMKSS